MRFVPVPEARRAETKSERIDRCRMRVLSYRVTAQSKSTLARFPYRGSNVLNWLHRRQNILECVVHAGAWGWRC
jgi:hypothetical protein